MSMLLSIGDIENKILYPDYFREDAITLILSGGMDSGVLLAYLASKGIVIHSLSFNYKSKHNRRELVQAEKLANRYAKSWNLVDISFFSQLYHSALLEGGAPVPNGHYEDEKMKQTVVPFRNGIFLAIAVGYAEEKGDRAVVLGSHTGDHAIYPDCRLDFTESFSQAAQLGTYQGVKVFSPFASLDKREIADLGRFLEFSFEDTWTCYKGGKKHCGVCGACFERKYALRFDEGLDPTGYLV